MSGRSLTHDEVERLVNLSLELKSCYFDILRASPAFGKSKGITAAVDQLGTIMREIEDFAAFVTVRSGDSQQE